MSKYYEKIYLDLDMTLVDTAGASLAHHGFPDAHKKPENLGKYYLAQLVGMSKENFWAPLTSDFWANIPKLPWCDNLINKSISLVGEENVFFLTSPIFSHGCFAGKFEWVNKNYPHMTENLIIASNKEACVGKDGILIDDAEGNEKKFKEAGKEFNFFLFPSLGNRKHNQVEGITWAPMTTEWMLEMVLND